MRRVASCPLTPAPRAVFPGRLPGIRRGGHFPSLLGAIECVFPGRRPAFWRPGRGSLFLQVRTSGVRHLAVAEPVGHVDVFDLGDEVWASRSARCNSRWAGLDASLIVADRVGQARARWEPRARRPFRNRPSRPPPGLEPSVRRPSRKYPCPAPKAANHLCRFKRNGRLIPRRDRRSGR